MSSGEWATLVGVLLAISVPGIGAWITVWVKLNVLEAIYKSGHQIMLEKIQSRDQEILTMQESIKELWQAHNHQEGRLFMQDRVLARLIQKLDIHIDEIDYRPKDKPHLGGD